MADERDPSEPVDRYELAIGPNATRDDDMARAAHQREDSPAPTRRARSVKKRSDKRATKSEET